MELCKKSYIQDKHPRADKKSCSKEPKTVKCELCKKSFRNTSSLEIHMRIHTGGKAYFCMACLKRFSCSSYLKSHITTTHSGKKPFECHVCEKRFSRASYLRQHVRIHALGKPYLCHLCQKLFSRSSSKKIHMMIHFGDTREKPYLCQLCTKSFTLHTP